MRVLRRRPVTGPSPARRDDDALREALRHHHPIMRSETGPFSGCRCGGVRLGEDVIAHVLAHLAPAVEAHARRVAERVAERELRAAADVPLKACCPEHASKRLRARAAALAATDDNEGDDRG